MAERHRIECPEQVTRARCALDLSLFTVQLLEEKAWVEVDRASPKRSHECTDSPAHSLIRRPVAQLRLLSEMGDKITLGIFKSGIHIRDISLTLVQACRFLCVMTTRY